MAKPQLKTIPTLWANQWDLNLNHRKKTNMAKPQRGLSWLQDIIDANKKAIGKDSVILIGIRGYFRDSMGKVGANDRGIYDDALFWLNLSNGFLANYNGNCDPSSYRKGKGRGAEKGMASLKAGVWRYQTGLHRGYAAFRQAAPVVVVRDGTAGNYEDTGDFGINIHRGGASGGTSSLGCQTLPVAQWDDFKATGYKLLKDAGQKTFCYILVERQG